MFDVQKHIEGDQILYPMTQRSGDVMSSVTMMMNAPNCEERGHALTYEHSAHMVAKDATVKHSEHERDPDCVEEQFSCYDCAHP